MNTLNKVKHQVELTPHEVSLIEFCLNHMKAVAQDMCEDSEAFRTTDLVRCQFDLVCNVQVHVGQNSLSM